MASKTKAKQQHKKARHAHPWLWPIGALLLLGCIAYGNSTDGPFVFDDFETIQRNAGVRFGDYLSASLLHTRSLLFLTFAVNNWVGGQNVFGYHLVNLVLHILNGILVFAIAFRIFRNTAVEETTARMYALCAAAFFLVHPIQTESVTYISSRSELLSTLFYLLAWGYFVITPPTKAGFFRSLVVLGLLLLGYGGKETVVTLPLAILIYDYLFVAGGQWRPVLKRWRFYIGFIALTAAASYYLLARQVVILTRDYAANFSPWTYLLTQQRVILRYIRLIVFPTGLNLDYDFRPSISIREPAVLLSFLFISGAIFLAWKWRRTHAIFSFSILWFFIALSPTSSIIPIPDAIYEHRLYLPLAGVCLSFPFVIEWLIRTATGNVTPRAVTGLAGALLVLCTIATLFRNEVWRDEVRLFSDVVAKSPHKLRAYNALIFAEMKRGQEQTAISVAKVALENVPLSRVFLFDTIGNLYLRLHQAADAAEYFKKSSDEAIRLGFPPDYLATSYNNRGVAYLALSKTFQTNAGQLSEGDAARRTQALHDARDSFQKSFEANSNNVHVLDSLINVRHALGEANVLEEELRRRLATNPHEFASLYGLAALLSLEERYADSLNYFEQAAQMNKNSEVVPFNYAFALSKAGQIDRAIGEYSQALQIDPIFSEAHYNLALLYIQKADYDSAVRQLNDILSWEANNVRANMKLAEIHAYTGKLALARQHLQQVLNADPQNAQALGLFQKIGAAR